MEDYKTLAYFVNDFLERFFDYLTSLLEGKNKEYTRADALENILSGGFLIDKSPAEYLHALKAKHSLYLFRKDCDSNQNTDEIVEHLIDEVAYDVLRLYLIEREILEGKRNTKKYSNLFKTKHKGGNE